MRTNLRKLIIIILVILPVMAGCGKRNNLPNEFVFLADIDSTIIENLRYATSENFLGKPVPGYMTGKVVCTKQAAEQIKAANDEFRTLGYRIVVYDAYRPQQATDAFIKWSEDHDDQVAKPYYYPGIDKAHVFDLGYIVKKSAHMRGSTFDITIIHLNRELKPINYLTRKLLNGEEIPFLDDNTLDMGSSFDLFHKASGHDCDTMAWYYLERRALLRTTMEKHGFVPLEGEWWHYTLKDEPFPDTYFNFIVKDNGLPFFTRLKLKIQQFMRTLGSNGSFSRKKNNLS